MADTNYTNEPVNIISEFYRECKNAEHNCAKKLFMAKNLQVIYCSDKCKDAYNNRKKRELTNGTSKVYDANLKKFKTICDNNLNPIFNKAQLLAYGIDLLEYDEKIILDTINNRFVLRFGNYFLQRIDKDLFRIYTKKITKYGR